MGRSSTWTALPETEYKCQACDMKIRCTHKEDTYLIWCPKCGSSVVIKADSAEAAYEDAKRESVIYLDREE